MDGMATNTNPTQYHEILTSSEIKQVTTDLLQRQPGLPRSELEIVLQELAFLAASSMLFQGVISGDLEVIGVDEGGLRVKSTDRAKRLLH